MPDVTPDLAERAKKAWYEKPSADELAPSEVWWDSDEDAWLDGYETGASSLTAELAEARRQVEVLRDAWSDISALSKWGGSARLYAAIDRYVAEFDIPLPDTEETGR